jgi:hypothetical protein
VAIQQEEAISQLTKVYNTQLTRDEKIMQFLKRFTFEGGFSCQPVQFAGGRHLIGYGTDPSTNSSVTPVSPKTASFCLSTLDGVRFELNKHFSLVWNLSAALYGIDQFQTALGVNYRIPLHPSGRGVYLDLGLAGSLSNSYVSIGTIINPDMPIRGKSLDGNRLDLKAGENRYGLTGMTGLAVRLGKQTELFADGFYIQPLFKKPFVQFKETNGFFLTRKKATVPWDDPSLYYYLDEKLTDIISEFNLPFLKKSPTIGDWVSGLAFN